MNLRIIWLLIAMTVVCPQLVSAKAQTREGEKKELMLHDLTWMHHLFYVTYAPLLWKQVHYGFDLDAEVSKVYDKINGTKGLTTKEFQRLVKEFCLSTKDYHVVAEFFSTEAATLPFCIQSAEGKYFISYVDADAYRWGKPLISVGDEVLSFDGVHINDAMSRFRDEEVGTNFEGTDKALTELYFTTRLGCLGQSVPEGPVRIVVRNAKSNKTHTLEMQWDYTPEFVLNAPAVAFNRGVRPVEPQASRRHSYYRKIFQTPQSEMIKRVRPADIGPSVMLGAKKSMLPTLGKILWEAPNESAFHAYLFQMPSGRKAAYVRIPTYSGNENDAQEFLSLIKRFEKEADALVIDQLNNPGGSILYLYALLSMLTDRPLELPLHRIKITQEDVFLAVTEIGSLALAGEIEDVHQIMGKTLDGLTVDWEIAGSFARSFAFVHQQWEEGKCFTDFHHIYGIEEIRPHPEGHFSKPILVLVNSLAFSAGDFFPAIMQDNRRGKIMGTRTAGAGGYIEKVSFPNLSGISEIDLTASYAERPGRRPIENFGVTPDIPYGITRKDLQQNYKDYVARILQELEGL